MKYKMVVLDLDGTLLNDNKEISVLNARLLSALQAQKIEIVIATGRRYAFARELFENIGFPLTIICSGGSLARSTLDDRTILARHLPVNLFHEVVGAGRSFQLHPLIHVDRSKEGYDFLLEFERDSPFYNSYLTGNVKEYLVVGDFLEYRDGGILLMCYMGGEKDLEVFQSHIMKKHGGRLHTHILTTLKRIGPVLEIMHPQGTKWRTIADYSRSLNISPEEIVAMGDDTNDIEMITHSGLGIAMKNAPEKVKSLAGMVTGHSNNEDGVARTLAGVFGLQL